MADLSQIPTDQLLQMLQPGNAAPTPVPNPMPQPQVAPPQQPATWRQQLMAGPVGQAMGGAMQGIEGLDQLAYKGGSELTSLGGYYPNSVSNALNNTANSIGTFSSQEAQAYAGARKAATGKTGFSPGWLGGEIASPANAVAGEMEIPAAIAAKIPMKGLATALLKGSAYGAANPVDPNDDYASSKATQIALGAALGSGGHAIGSIANPMGSIDPKAATLLKAGVPLTVGQTLGGIPRTLEDASTSIPVVGDFVKARQRDALAGLNTAVINRGLAPIGEKLPDGIVGHKAIQYGQDKFGDAYDDVLSRMSAQHDPQLVQDLSGVATNGGTQFGLSPASQQIVNNKIQNLVVGKSNGGFYDGDALKDVQSGLRYQANNYSKNSDPEDKNIGDALNGVRDIFNDFIARQNPNDAPTLQAINSGYATFSRAEKAAAASKTGIFSPSELARAVKAGGTQAQNASGRALGQDLSSAGQAILPSTVPDSGTPLRHFVDMGIGALAGGGEHLATGDAGLRILAGGTALTAGATRPAQTVMRAILTKRPYSQQTAAQLGALLSRGAPRLAAPVVVPAMMQNAN